jgi:hypothetical protein
LLSDKLLIHLVHEFLDFNDDLAAGLSLGSPFFDGFLAPNLHILGKLHLFEQKLLLLRLRELGRGHWLDGLRGKLQIEGE